MKLQKEKEKIREEHFEFSRFKLDSLVKIQITKARRREKKTIKSERLKRRKKSEIEEKFESRRNRHRGRTKILEKFSLN